MACLAQRFPGLRFLVHGATNGEAAQMAGRHLVHRHGENIWIDTSVLDCMDVLAKVTRDIPADRLVFGTAEPFLYARSNVLLFAAPTLSDADKAMIARGNAAAMIR